MIPRVSMSTATRSSERVMMWKCGGEWSRKYISIRQRSKRLTVGMRYYSAMRAPLQARHTGRQRYPNKKFHTPGWRGSLSRGSGLPLARATLLLTWQACRAHLDTACILLGISRPAAEIIAGFALTEIDRIADRRFRHLHPRWQDRPDLWRSILAASESSSGTALRKTDLQALALVAGELMPFRAPREA